MKNVLILCFTILTLPVFAQVTISGVVTDVKGEPVPGANVLLLNTYDGTTSGLDGKFSFTTTEKGMQSLVVKFIGFKEYQLQLDLSKSHTGLTIALKEEINQLEAVTITAGAFAASDESRRTIFKALDIATTAGATADIAGALNTL